MTHTRGAEPGAGAPPEHHDNGGASPERHHSTARSAAIMARARSRFPGGVNSPVRAFGGVGGEPPFPEARRPCRP